MLSGYTLSLYIGGQPAPRDVIDSLRSAQVTTTAGQASGFQLSFSSSKKSRLQAERLPSGFLDPLTRVQIVVTVAGQPNVLVDGLIARLDETASSEPGATTVNVTGEDVTLAMRLVDLSGLPYPCLTRELRMIAALAKYAFLGVVPIVIPSVFIENPIPLENWKSHAGTDLDYLQSQANEVGYVFYVTSGPLGVNKAYWGPEVRYGDVQPALSINMDAHTNCESMSFSYDGTSAKLFLAMAQIPYTTFSIPVPIPGIGILRPKLAERSPFPFKFEILNRNEPDAGGAQQGPLQVIGLGLARAAAAADCVTANGSLNVLRYGRILEPRKLVDVRGAGRTFDGRYYVKSVTHNIKRGEYKQSFSLVREGTVPATQRVRVA
jgi:hypothetical protein